MKIKQLVTKATHNLKKHSPAILLTAGATGLVATAYLAYKAHPKVEAVVEKMEERTANGEEVNAVEVVKDITEAVYKPVVVGAASLTCIVLSYRVTQKRMLALMGALAVEQGRNVWFEKKYRKEHGNEEWNKFVAPTEEFETTEVGKNGKEKITVHQVKSDVDKTIGQWYDDSSEYARDDHTYNMEMIRSVNDRLQTVLFQRGTLTLNEVREALGFERIRAGALLGWSTSDTFDIDRIVSNIGEEALGETREQIWVTWSRPRYIYDDVEFNTRYAI